MKHKPPRRSTRLTCSGKVRNGSLRPSYKFEQRREDGRCAYQITRECRERGGRWCRLTVDHIIPASRGGAEHPDNFALVCADCNNSKASLLLEEWIVALVLEELGRNGR